MKPETATVQALRSDLALQIARFIAREGLNQLAAAHRLGIPQPTVSKIVNGKVAELSLELLIRVAVRAGLPVVLQTGTDPAEAGVFSSGDQDVTPRRRNSNVSQAARDALLATVRQLTPQQRLEAHLAHSQLVTALRDAGEAVLTRRGRGRHSRRRSTPGRRSL